MGDAEAPAAPDSLRERSALARVLGFVNSEAAPGWTSALLEEFGSIGGVMAQSPAGLVRAGASAGAASLLSSVGELTGHWLRSKAAAGPVLHDCPALMDYLRCRHAFAPNECLRVLFLTAKKMLLRDEILLEGTVDESPLWSRPILRRCLELNAAGVILVHNHPSGDLKPSRLDIQSTARFCQAAEELGVDLHDHLIMSSNGYTSFRALGLL